jgi:hypothetical protein
LGWPVKEEDDMAGERGGSRRRGYDPLVAGISDGVAAGYRALESVYQGLAESLERRPDIGSRRDEGGQRRRSPRGAGPPLDIIDDLASLIADLLDRAGEVAQETAHSITERSWVPEHDYECPRLGITGEPGAEASADFRVWNTSSKTLARVDLFSTDLLGQEAAISADAVTFAPSYIDRIPPNRSASPKVVVKIPADATEGTYRGVIQAKPGDAWAILEVTVKPPKPETEKPPGERPRDRPRPAPPSDPDDAEPVVLAEPEPPPSAREMRRTGSRRRERR